MTPTISVSVVVYQSDLGALRGTVASLGGALERAREEGLLQHATVTLVDNKMPDEVALDAMVHEESARVPWVEFHLIRGQGNVGYGRGHNLAILSSDAVYHLVLNPDVVIAPEALAEGIRFFLANPDVGLVAPDIRTPDGERQYVCRRYPSVFMLFLRGFGPAPLRRLFRSYMEAHELRPLIGDSVVKGIPTVGGCFMFARLDVLRAVGGFSPDYFVYFEDYDLSVRLGRRASLAFVPAVRITHTGGNTARKGMRHILLFIQGAATFFRTHGWKLA
ncbi:MAG: glycosyltransferase family 2 protein [Gemmatimonadales bacterium]